jgi:Mn2+/Fe2+ NRAMP family transporter
VGNGTGTVFALALLASGQSSTITGTMAGQVRYEIYFDFSSYNM